MATKIRSKSVEPIFNHQHRKSTEKTMKKSPTTLTAFESKTIATSSPLRRRFSLFRLKRSHPSPDQCHIQTLEQIIDQLRHDLQLKTFELDSIRQRSRLLSPPSNQSIEQALQLQTILNGKLDDMLMENDLLKRSIQELETFLHHDFANSSPLEPPIDHRHKSEVEIDLRPMSPVSSTFHSYQSPKRRLFNTNEESFSKNEKIQALLNELNDSQAMIAQQEQQLMNGKKEREQLCAMVDQRTNELCNLKEKNEQLQQMIRHGDGEKLLSLLQESHHEQERIYERLKHSETDTNKMREQLLCSKIKLEKKIEENERLMNELTEMKSKSERVEQEKQRFQMQIEDDQMKIDELTQLKNYLEVELTTTMEKLRCQRYENESKMSNLEETLRTTQKQFQYLQQSHRTIQEKHEKEIDRYKEHIQELEGKIEQIIEERTMISIRCEELFEENHQLEKSLNEKQDEFGEKLQVYREKNSQLNNQLEEMEKKYNETRKHFEAMIAEKDETLADMLVAVRVASEMRHDAENRLSQATDDLKRVTEHIEQERTTIHRRQAMQLPPSSPTQDLGHVRIKEMIRTLEANSRNNLISPNRQRPLSQPCTLAETNAMLINSHARTLTPKCIKTTTPSTNRSDLSMRSITNEQYDEMKSIVETVFHRVPGSVCKRDALLKWCGERLGKYGISITNFSNSWTDGLAFCSLLHSYLPERLDLDFVKKESKRKRFEIAFTVASSVGIVPILDIDEMCSSEWPDWERVMYYVALIFRHFEGTTPTQSISPILPLPQTNPSSNLSSPSFTSSSSSSSPMCVSLRPSNSIPMTLASALQTV